MTIDKATADHISQVIQGTWSQEELLTFTQMQAADLNSSIWQQINQQGPDSVTVEWMSQRKEMLEDYWSGDLDDLLFTSLATR